jgi:hypothetical protein
MALRPGQSGATQTTPPAVSIITKTVQIARTDTTAFDAVVLPAGVVLAGVYVMGQTASDAASTAVLNVGSNPGTTNEVLAAFDVKGTTGTGYNAAAQKHGTKVGVQITADTLVKAKYTETGTASTTGGPWLVKIEYYYPQSGQTF